MSNEETEKLIEDYVERETTGARKQVEDAEAAVQHEQEDMRKVEYLGLMNREPEQTFQKMMVAMGDSVSDLATSDNVEDGEDEDDEETELGQPSDDDEAGWMTGTIMKTVQQRIQRFLQKQMKLDKFTQPGLENTADYFRERDKKYCTSALRVPALCQLQTYDIAATPVPTTIGELLGCQDIVPAISYMPHGTSRPGSSHIGLGFRNLQWHRRILDLAPSAKPDSSFSLNAKPVELVSFNPGI